MESGFRLEIHGLAEFAAFVALIRGQTLDATMTTLRDLTARLTQSTADLADAETTAPPPPSAS